MSVRSPGTLMVMLSFEGPDVYSQAGGLGVREKELSRVLARLGYETHLFFIGDPALPGSETQLGGRLHLHRWAQWLSRGHPGGVYDGEDVKLREWNRSLPDHLIDTLVAPAAAAGRPVVILAEEWQTARTVGLIARGLAARGLRQRVVILWNANNLYGFDGIDWRSLAAESTITTVSRYMKQRMLAWKAPAIVIPNGIPREAISDPPGPDLVAVREAAGAEIFSVKIGRFDPDKRWLMAVDAVATLKREGVRVRLLMRGGREPHGAEVLARAAERGLTVAGASSPQDAGGLARLLHAHRRADVVNLLTFVPESLLGTIYASADAVLANSGHEPFGLVGLEVMAAGGLAITGSTGEDYAISLMNAVVMETDDPEELAAGLRLVRARPALARRIRREGRRTARGFVWENIVQQLLYRIELAALRQSAVPPAARLRAGRPRTATPSRGRLPGPGHPRRAGGSA